MKQVNAAMTLLVVLMAVVVSFGFVSLATAENEKGDAKEGDKDAPRKLRKFEEKAINDNVRGTYDMSKSPRPYVVFLILDQEGNRYPSFWCGRNDSGKLTIEGKVDWLSGKLNWNQSGSASLRITNAAHKKGMHEKIPAGVWMDTLGEKPFTITLKKVTDPVFIETRTEKFTTGDSTTRERLAVYFDVKVAGDVTVGDKTAAFEGDARMGFYESPQTFSLRATFPFPGEKLGLGEKGKGITATLHTRSPVPSKVIAPRTPDDLEDPLGGLR